MTATIRNYWIAFIVIELLLASFVYALYRVDRREQQFHAQTLMRTSIKSDVLRLAKAFDNARSDLFLLATDARLNAFLAGDESRREELEDYYLRFANTKDHYDQVRVLDENGVELIRINLDKGKAIVVGSMDLQDKSHREYIHLTQTLEAGLVGVSKFDLNVEHKHVERPIKPVIRFVTPIFVDNQRRGAIVLNFLGRQLLSELGDVSTRSHQWLLDADGDYLKGGLPPADFAKYLGQSRSFRDEYAQAWAVMSEQDSGHLSLDEGEFAFQRVSPQSLTDHHSNRRDERLDTDLILVSFLTPKQMASASQETLLLTRLLPLFAFMTLIVLVSTIGLVKLQMLRQEQDRSIAQTMRLLKRSNADLERYAFVASHDLLSPLRAVAGLAQWVMDDAAMVLPEKSRAHLTLMRGRIHRMQGFLKDLLAFSRVGKHENTLEEINLGELFQHILELNPPPPGFQIQLPENLPTVRTNRIPLLLCLQNLIVNAIKHHDQDAGCVTITYTLHEGVIDIRVADDGPGIPKTYQKRVFEIFQTLRPRDEIEGSGMGLAIVLRAVETYGASIELNSDGIRGTEFLLCWPITPRALGNKS